MTERVLVDTGPIVAAADPADQHHHVCIAECKRLPAPLLTCWPVITEAAWILRHRFAAIDALFASIRLGAYHILALADGDAPAIFRFMQRYRNLGAQLADAALLHLAERENIRTIFTLDRRDLSVYRVSRGRRLKLLPRL